MSVRELDQRAVQKPVAAVWVLQVSVEAEVSCVVLPLPGLEHVLCVTEANLVFLARICGLRLGRCLFLLLAGCRESLLLRPRPLPGGGGHGLFLASHILSLSRVVREKVKLS